MQLRGGISKQFPVAPRPSHGATLSRRCHAAWGGFGDHLQQSTVDTPPCNRGPQHFGTRDWFSRKTIFPRIDEVGLTGGDSLGMIQVHLHLLCALFLFLLHQLLLKSSGIRSQRLGTPVLENSLKKSSLFRQGVVCGWLTH